MEVRILLLGSGAREHAIVTALLAEDADHDVIAAPGNAGIADDVTTISLDPENPAVVADFASDNDIELVIVGPEAPLVAGVADAVRAKGIPVFGPGRAAAQLEGSKAFAKRVMDAAGVPTGRAVRSADIDEVASALDEFGAPYVVKADGLAAGKGVLVTADRDAALAHAEHFLQLGPVLVELHPAARWSGVAPGCAHFRRRRFLWSNACRSRISLKVLRAGQGRAGYRVRSTCRSFLAPQPYSWRAATISASRSALVRWGH